MDKISELSKQKIDDIANDPNMILSVAIINTINQQSKTSKTDARNQNSDSSNTNPAQAPPKPQEVVELAPIQEIAIKLRSRKMLTRDELALLSVCISSKFSDLKEDQNLSETSKLKDILTIIYYSILNTHSYSYCQNFLGKYLFIQANLSLTMILERSTHQKLCTEMLNLVKRVLELITVNDTPDIKQFNQTLPIIFKILSTLESKSAYDEAQYRYLRAQDLRIDTYSLVFLNQYMIQMAPQLYGIQKNNKAQAVKVEEQAQSIIQLNAGNIEVNDNDSIEMCLDFMPVDYINMTNMLNQHLQSNLMITIKDEEMSQVDEEEEKARQGEGSEDFIQAAQNNIHKLNIIDLLSKTIEMVIQKALEEKDTFLEFDSSLLPKILNQIKMKQIRTYQFVPVLTEQMIEKVLESQRILIDQSKTQNSEMEIQPLGTDSTQIETTIKAKEEQIVNAISIIAKYAEFLCQAGISQENESIAKHLEMNFQTIIKNAECFEYLINLIKSDVKLARQMRSPILSFIQSILQNFVRNQQFFNQLEHEQQEGFIIILTNLVRAIQRLEIVGEAKPDKEKKKPKPQLQLKQASSTPVQSSSTTIRTRGQIKKEIITSAQKDLTSQVSKEETKEEEMKDINEEKQKDTIITKQQIDLKTIFKVDLNDTLKSCLSLLVLFSSRFINYTLSQKGELELSRQIINNLLKISQKPNQLITRLVYGILSEFTKSSIKFSENTKLMISQLLDKKLSKFLESNVSTVFAAKLMIMLKGTELSFDLSKKFITNQKLWDIKGQAPQNVHEIYEGTNLNKYIIFILSILNIEGDQKKRQQLLDQIFINIESNQASLLLSIHQLQLMLIDPVHMALLKKCVQQYIAKLITNNEIIEVQKMLYRLIENFNSLVDPQNESIFNEDLIAQNVVYLNQNYFVLKLKEFLKSSSKPDKIKQVAYKVLKFSTLFEKNQRNITLKELLENHQSDFRDSQANALLNLSVNKYHDQIQKKLKDQQALTEEDFLTIKLIIEKLSDQTAISNKIQLHILQDTYEPNAKNQEFGSLLNSLVNYGSNSVRVKIFDKLPQMLPEEKKFMQMITDPQQMMKNIQTIVSSESGEILYAHTLLHSNDQHQQYLSSLLLLKALFRTLETIVREVKGEEHAQMRNAISTAILQQSRIYPQLSMSELSTTVDLEFLIKLINELHASQLKSNELVKLVNLDRSLNSLMMIYDYIHFKQLAQAESSVQLLQLLQQIQNELSGVLSTAQFQQKADKQLLINYLTTKNESEHQYMKLIFQLKQNGRDIPGLMWQIATQFLKQSFSMQAQLSLQDDSQLEMIEGDISEKKGGVQLTINFSQGSNSSKQTPSRGRGTRKHQTSKPTSQSQQVKDEEMKQVESEDQAKPKAGKEPKINVVAQKMLYFLNDLMDYDKSQEATEEEKSLSQIIRMEFLNATGLNEDNLIGQLYKLKQIPLLKNILHSLISLNNDQQSKQILSTRIQQLLINFIEQKASNQDEQQFLTLILELILLISDNNTQIISCIQTHILNKNLCQSITSKVQILDFMTQLGLAQFSKVSQDKIVYSQEQIQETRLKEQLKKMEEQKKKKVIQSQQLQNEEEALANITSMVEASRKDAKKSQENNVEGYKQSQLIMEDSKCYEKYMEKPEDICTYTQTKKDFKNQHWYFCYTCDLTESNGICAVCVRKCHKGHQVTYSRKSNFFCDCAESGKCISLKPSAQAAKPKEGSLNANAKPFIPKSKERPQERSSLFGNPPEVDSAFEGLQMPSGLARFIPNNTGAAAFGFSSYSPQYQLDGEEEDEEGNQYHFLEQFKNSILDRPQNSTDFILQKIGLKNEIRRIEGRYLDSESSDEEQRDENDDNIDIGHLTGIRQLKDVSKLMQILKKDAKYSQPPPMFSKNPFSGVGGSGLNLNRDEPNRPPRRQSSSSLSQMTNILPLEDPLSDAGSTPIHTQQFQLGESLSHSSQSSASKQKDDEMEDSTLYEDARNAVKQQRQYFLEIYTQLIGQLDEQINNFIESDSRDSDEIMSSFSSPRKLESRNQTLVQTKSSTKVIQDMCTNKKSHKDNTFNIKLTETSKQTINIDLNLLHVVDSNQDGLVAICEKESELAFYPSSQFFEENCRQQASDQFTYEVKEGQEVSKVETYNQLGFNVLHLKFNPAYPQYLAVAGTQSVEVLTLSKQGKVISKLSVDLMLQMISRELTIKNIHWLPGSQTMIAVATRDFVKVYDLAEDNICPIYNFQLFNGFITDFAFGKMTQTDIVGKVKCTVFITSLNAQVYFHEFTYKIQSLQNLKIDDEVMRDQSQDQGANSEVILTRVLSFDSSLKVTESMNCVSVYFSKLADVLIISMTQGVTIIGKPNFEQGTFNGFYINFNEDSTNYTGNTKTLQQKYGDNLVCFKDVECLPNESSQISSKYYIQAISRKLNNLNSGIPVLLEISNDLVNINFLKTTSTSTLVPCFGLTYSKCSNKNYQSIHRLISIQSDGSSVAFSVNPLCVLVNKQETQGESISKFFMQQQLIKKSDLPKEVKMPVNFFEKMKNVYTDSNLKSKLSLSSDIVTHLKTSKATIEALSKNSNQPCIAESSKKSMKMNIKLDIQTDHVLTGIRVRIEQQPKLSQDVGFRLFHRQIKLRAKSSLFFFDIPFCDAEVIFGATNVIECEFITEDVARVPIRIYCIEFFAQSKKEFGFKDKIKRLERLTQDKNNQFSSKDQNITLDTQLKNEMLKSSGNPILSWKEKQKLLGEVDEKQRNLILSLDLISQQIDVLTQNDQVIAQNLIERLRILMKEQLYNDKGKQSYFSKAVQRCLIKLLENQNPQPKSNQKNPGFYQIKDEIIIEVILSRLNSNAVHREQLTQVEIRFFLDKLNKIYSKRNYKLFMAIEQDPNLIQQLVRSYFESYKSSDSHTLKDIQNLSSLIFANYYFLVNQGFEQQDKNLRACYTEIYQRKELEKFFYILEPMLMHQDEIIQKTTTSSIIKILNQYSQTVHKSIQLQQLPLIIIKDNNQNIKRPLMINDASPHFIQFLLSLVTILKDQADLQYSLAYKVIKLYESRYANLVSNNPLNEYLLEFIAKPISEFIIKSFGQVNANQDLYNKQSLDSASYLYTNLAFVNLLMMPQSQGLNRLKSRAQKISLMDRTAHTVINFIQEHQEAQSMLSDFVIGIMRSYERGFKSGQCSYVVEVQSGFAQDVKENLQNENIGGTGARLLRPIREIKQWKWHPIFLQTDYLFEVLDRKIPAQVLIFYLNLISKLQQTNQVKEKISQSIVGLCFSKPANEFLKKLGEAAVLQAQIPLSAEDSLMNEDSKEKTDLQETMLIQQLNLESSFQEFYDQYEPIYTRYIKKKGVIQFNALFQIHSILQNIWNAAKWSPKFWNKIVSENQKQSRDILKMLIESSYALNEDSASLCLALCCLSFENSEDLPFSIGKTYTPNFSCDLYQVLQPNQLGKKYAIDNIDTSNLDLNKFINSLLLGRNQNQLRQLAAIIIKGIYESENGKIVKLLLDQLPVLKSFGVNAQEYLAVLQYVINREIQMEKISNQDAQEIVAGMKREIKFNNLQLTSHPNLVIYSTLQKLSSSASAKNETIIEQLKDSGKSLFGGGANAGLTVLAKGDKNSKITNPYMLESEACSKCYEQRASPYNAYRMNEMKTEHKCTDSTLIYKLNTTYNIKQIQMNISDIRGARVIKTLNIHINNKQGIDLADMRNNWSCWRLVKSVEVEVAQRVIDIDFPLPINATNILFEFQTCALSKPITGKEKPGHAASQNQQNQEKGNVTGLDTVLQTLSKDITQKIGYHISSNSKQLDVIQSNPFEKENMNCPRCGKPVQGRHGICNSCGENALQCTYCRNINYEKPDGFLCNECGNSRFIKFEFSFTAKPGFACEKIENDDMKNIATQQIDQNLQSAQSSYQQLMKMRNQFASEIQMVNDGYEGKNLKNLIEIYNDECTATYQKMMRSLNSIKILRSEIDKYQLQSSSSTEEESSDSRLQSLSSQQSSSQSQCFSCIQEQLRSQLNFIKYTSDSLRIQYLDQGFVDMLYENNLSMHKQSLQEPAKKAICSLIQNDQERCMNIFSRINKDVKIKNENVPAHLLQQTLKFYSDLVLEMIKTQETLNLAAKDNYLEELYVKYWEILINSIQESKENASIASQITASLMKKLLSFFQEKKNSKEPQKLNMITSNVQDSYLNPVLDGLIMPTSNQVREISRDIILLYIELNKDCKHTLLTQILDKIDELFTQSSNSTDQYFEILNNLLKEPINEEKVTQYPVYFQAFEKLFELVNNELENLQFQEIQRVQLGEDGYMPQIQTGQLLAKLVSQLASIIKDSLFLKSKIQTNVSLIIKSFLKIRKLNLVKNKLISDSEIELEKMFKELHSEKDEDKEKFILECMKIIEDGSCDMQEIRFLLEEICKVINPVKPEPEYHLNLHKAPTQEFYFRGKMSKNPYTSTYLGKTMEDVRNKICKEMEMAEPDLLELLVAGKIVGLNLTIKQVYEQIHWPALCKQRDPDSYEVPNIEEAPKTSLAPMSVIFRLMGIDGEATEDRVENLVDESELETNPAQIEKKYGITQVFTKQFDSKRNQNQQINGICVLIDVLSSIQQLQKQRYLAEWLFNLISYIVKIKVNRKAFVHNRQTIGLIAKRLFESVGMQIQIEGQKGQTLFDNILAILECIVSEVNQDDEQQSSLIERMDIDSQNENQEAAIHVEIFIQIMSDACNEMTANLIPIDKTSKKIRAVSKILPFLIKAEDTSAIQIIIDFLEESIQKISDLDKAGLLNKEKLEMQFNLERVIEILENTTVQKNFIKDSVLQCEQLIPNLLKFLAEKSLVNTSDENALNQFKLGNQYGMKLLNALVKNHPQSQKLLQNCKVLDLIYSLTQAKHREKVYILLAQDIIESLTNKNNLNDASVKDYLQGIINSQNEEKKKLAQRKKEEIMRQMQNKKNANKFIKQIENVQLQEETGPKCIVCQDGYTKKPTDILGMYVFSKKVKITEISESNQGFINTQGYITVTHSNYIHFTCHQNAYRADASLKQPKKEWEGAAIRNDHTKCNNLFPLRGGNLPEDSYYSMVEKYFNLLTKTVGQCDSDKVKVVLHDFKILLKRLAYEDSFSRDSQGGGPEQNSHLIPFMIQMIAHILKYNEQYKDHSDDKTVTYIQEKRLIEFLESGIKKKQDFMQKLEEEKKVEEIEEEEKFSEDMSSCQDEDDAQEGDSQMNQINNIKLDLLAFKLTQALVFTQMPKWETMKSQFLSIILCTIAGMRDDRGTGQVLKPTGQQSDFATGKKVLTISKLQDQEMQETVEAVGQRRRRLSSDNKIELVQRSLFRLRPLLIQMRLVDLVKQRWDGKRLSLLTAESKLSQDEYFSKLNSELIGKGNLQESIQECDEIFREYKERMLKLASVEEFLQDLGMLEGIVKDYGSVESYVLSHF
ncbi:e3 ubiquitin-protein ligase ubr4 [Stylonychia lemnae]|uniref:E3 ubiquitin-protein ligase ubr4 n=1 Tax=Stylonychia lemnae TaxID=5949 RepID=A0A078A8J9_STYLE|nr:e3 ubiquitin-protein ligase ubr4 [Stylonychia lemnae]|eukprot:CDW77116.1 e3 ubiquitin-protein ligase ubr4 [Stylonychia lemnae]